MKFKANHDLLLPNGELVKAGEVFAWKGDAASFLSVVEPVAEPAKKGKAAKAEAKEEPAE